MITYDLMKTINNNILGGIIMFERIKCYRNLKKADKVLLGMLNLGEIINNKDMIYQARDVLAKNTQLRKKCGIIERWQKNIIQKSLKY